MTTTLAHIDGMTDVFSDVTRDCLMLDLTPCTVKVDVQTDGSYEVWVQFSGTDVASVNTLADNWDCGPAELIGQPPRQTYIRRGRFDLDGRKLAGQIFTGHPGGPVPPPSYRPQPVEDAKPRCSECFGSGGWTQPDGLIVECPRGCMNGGDQ